MFVYRSHRQTGSNLKCCKWRTVQPIFVHVGGCVMRECGRQWVVCGRRQSGIALALLRRKPSNCAHIFGANVQFKSESVRTVEAWCVSTGGGVRIHIYHKKLGARLSRTVTCSAAEYDQVTSRVSFPRSVCWRRRDATHAQHV